MLSRRLGLCLWAIAFAAAASGCAATSDGTVRGFLPACLGPVGGPQVVRTQGGKVVLVDQGGNVVARERVVQGHAFAFTVPAGSYRVVPVGVNGVSAEAVQVPGGRITTIRLGSTCR